MSAKWLLESSSLLLCILPEKYAMDFENWSTIYVIIHIRKFPVLCYLEQKILPDLFIKRVEKYKLLLEGM